MTPLFKRSGLKTVFQKRFISVILFKSRLLKSFFSSLVYSLLPKFCCCLKNFTFPLDLLLGILQLCPFHYCFLIVFVTYAWCMISFNCFVFNWSTFSQNFKKDFFKTIVWWNVLIPKEFLRSVLNFSSSTDLNSL